MPTNPRPGDFKALLTTAHALADLSGPVTLRHFRKHPDVDDKNAGGAFDPVTEADRGAERVIVRALTKAFPDHGIVGEEYGTKPGTSAYQWVIDPVDGTRAFIMGSPLWGTLIGVLNDGAPYLGVMDQPFTGERFWSGPTGSFMRSNATARAKPIRTRACVGLQDAILATTHPDLFEGARRRKALANLKSQVRLTRYGGDCYNYCLLAAGFVDVIVEASLKPYDIVALIPIIEKAGGRVTTWTGAPASSGGDIVATGDPSVHDAVLEMLAKK